MSDSVRAHRRQPTRLLCPWDSPGKNTGVGCHFLLQCMKVKSESEVAQLCLTLSDPMDCSLPGSSIHGILQARVLEWSAIAFSETNLDSILKSRNITLPTKICLVKTMVFPVFMCGCEMDYKESCCCFCVTSVVSDSVRPHRRQPTRLPSLGFSRQEHWSRLPFPSPMHKSESEVAQSCPTLRNPMDCRPPGSSVHGTFQARVLEWGACLPV